MGLQKEYHDDAVIINEGELNKFMFLVMKGTVALYLNYRQSGEYLLGLCSKGKVFGELGLLCHEKSYYTAVAVGEVKTVVFSEFELESFVKGYPEQALGVIRSIARMNKLMNLNMKMIIEDTKAEKHSHYYEEYIKGVFSGEEAEQACEVNECKDNSRDDGLNEKGMTNLTGVEWHFDRKQR